MSSRETPFVPVFRPLLEQEEIDAAVGALRNGWLGMGNFVGEFEAAVSRVIGAEDRHVVAVSTGHAAIHLALMLVGVGPGDEVITPAFNNIADFQAILACGAEPVMCDVLDDTVGIDPDQVEDLITPRTKAIIGMDYACHFHDHDRLQAIADKHGLRLIHDAAHAFGAACKGRPIGSFSDIAMFSFDAVKSLTCIDAGVLVVRREEEMRILREMRLMGLGQSVDVMYQNRRAWTHDVRRLGFRYHLANLHAAIGLAQIGKLDLIRTSRQETFEYYRRELAGIDGLRLPAGDIAGTMPFIFYVRVDAELRDRFRDYLQSHGVDNGIHWQPGHWFTLFQNCRRGDLSRTDRIAKEIVTLPLHAKMDPDSAAQVVRIVRAFFTGEKDASVRGSALSEAPASGGGAE